MGKLEITDMKNETSEIDTVEGVDEGRGITEGWINMTAPPVEIIRMLLFDWQEM